MALIAWPVAADYDEAIQNPHLNFADVELKAGEVEYDRFGSPAVRSGNFASVYMVQSSRRKVAVRCFLREIPDQQERYAAIAHDLLGVGLPYTVNFEFVEQGIKVRGNWFPILKMDWCEGELLDEYIERNLANPVKLRRLSDKWFEMSVALRKEGLAHGDLQHGNVFIQDDEIKLIDYDGMFVPRLAGRKSNERGLEHYQHPGRTDSHYGRYLDNFSHWVIYTTLYALSCDASLWRLVSLEDKHLIFRKKDLDRPEASETFNLLKRHEDATVRTYATTVENLLQYDVEKIPDFHPDKPILYPPERPTVMASSRSRASADGGGLNDQSKKSGDRGNLFDQTRGGDRGGLFAEEKGGDRGRLFDNGEVDKQGEKQGEPATKPRQMEDPLTFISRVSLEHPRLAVAGLVAFVGVGCYVVYLLAGQGAPGESAARIKEQSTRAQQARYALEGKNYGEALQKYDDLMKLSTTEQAKSNAQVLKGLTHFQSALDATGGLSGNQGRPELLEAQKCFAEALATYPENAHAHDALGHAYDALGQHDKASEHYKEAERIDSSTYGSDGMK